MTGTKREITFDTGPQGQADFRKIKGGVKVITTEGEILQFDHEHIRCPVVTGTNLFYKLSKSKQWLYKCHPYGLYEDCEAVVESRFYTKLKWFPHKENEPARPYLKEGRQKKKGSQSWWDPERLQFSAEFEIIKGKLKGLLIPKSFLYGFTRDEVGNMKLKGQGAWAQRLDKFLYLAGYDFMTDEIEWSPDTILPSLEALLLERNKVIVVDVFQSYIQKMFSPPEGFSLT